MNLLTILYGCQYEEIAAKGKDGNKGRVAANVLLTIFLLLLIALIFVILYKYFPSALPKNPLRGFGPRTSGKIIALIGFGGVYGLVLLTVGTEANFHRQVAAYRDYPESVKKKANRLILVPFFSMMALVILLALL
jgi:hypothetical protein